VLRPGASSTRLPAHGGKVNGGGAGAAQRWRRRARRSVPVFRWLLTLLLPLAALTAVRAEKPLGENVHRPDVECRSCHTVARDVLEQDRVAARALLASDLEARCILCHGNEGPSHHTGIRPTKPVPDTLPLSAEGLITCATCHWVHGEQNPWGDFVRVNNARGGLCLTCHELSELG
jgi:hypothetical protein